MDLPTHAAFGLTIGLVFFGHPEGGVLVLLGALIPDLDRDWLAKANAIGEEQRHRAILHNVFVVGIAFLVSPFLALGAFLHMLQDSFTTANDKGCEWFYPVSRWVKHGEFDYQKKPMPLYTNERVYFLQEDPEDTINGPAIPWRRVYGPAQNSKILDRMFLAGSLIVAAVWFALNAESNGLLSANNWTWLPWHLVLLAALAVLLLAGRFLRGKSPNILRKAAKVGAGILGIALMVFWGFLAQSEIVANVEGLSASWVPIVFCGIFITVASWAVVELSERKCKPAAVV